MKLNEKHIKMIVGLSVLAQMFIVIFAIIFIPELAENKLLIHLLGIIEGAMMFVVGYYFGSSTKAKDEVD